MNIWLKVGITNGNTYRPGDVISVYPLADGESPPDLSHLKNPRGINKYASVAVVNMPARYKELEQAKGLFLKPWEEPPADPEGEREAFPPGQSFMPRRRFHIDRTRMSAANAAALFDDPPYTLTITWTQLRSGMRNHKENRAVRDNDIPPRRVP